MEARGYDADNPAQGYLFRQLQEQAKANPEQITQKDIHRAMDALVQRQKETEAKTQPEWKLAKKNPDHLQKLQHDLDTRRQRYSQEHDPGDDGHGH
jgi:hypothetical protein